MRELSYYSWGSDKNNGSNIWIQNFMHRVQLKYFIFSASRNDQKGLSLLE